VHLHDKYMYPRDLIKSNYLMKLCREMRNTKIGKSCIALTVIPRSSVIGLHGKRLHVVLYQVQIIFNLLSYMTVLYI